MAADPSPTSGSFTGAARLKLFTLAALIPLIAGSVVFGTLHQEQQQFIAAEQDRYGLSLAKQLSANTALLAIEQDMVSLNVMATRMAELDPVRSVAIYTDENRLIAQGGSEDRADRFFTAEITFQEETIGYTRVGVSSPERLSPAGYLLAGGFLLYLVIAWQMLPRVNSWLESSSSASTQPNPEPPVLEEEFTTGPVQISLLVIRLRPARRLDANFETFFGAAEIYRGIVEQTTPEELVVHFEGADAIYRAACCGLLMQSLASALPGNISFGGTLDILQEETGETRKAASYLASIAEGDLLVVGNEALLRNRASMESFHHSLVDSGNLLRVTGLLDDGSLDEQARKLLNAAA